MPHPHHLPDPEHVIVIDEQDRPAGSMEKLAAHRAGALHRAFSIMIGDGLGNILLQRRDLGKYHCGGLWANSCCGHPRPGEDVQAAAQRRLREELNFNAALTGVGTFRYRATVGNGLIENEYVHLFHGRYQGGVDPNPAEVMALKWVAPSHFDDEGSLDGLTPWFRLYIAEHRQFLRIQA